MHVRRKFHAGGRGQHDHDIATKINQRAMQDERYDDGAAKPNALKSKTGACSHIVGAA